MKIMKIQVDNNLYIHYNSKKEQTCDAEKERVTSLTESQNGGN